MRRIQKQLIAYFLVLLVLHSAASADNIYDSFTDSSYDLLESYCAAYNWEKSKMNVLTWTGTDGETYERTVGHQKSYYDDLYATSEELASTLGILPQTYGEGGNMAEVALQEVGVTENPRGSNHVKYNTWFYGVDVIDPMVNGEYQMKYAWCNVFVCWVANECGYLDNGMFLKTGGVRGEFYYLTQQQGFEYYPFSSCVQYGGSYTPREGDIVVWQRNRSFSHIGIVTGLGENYVQITSGNMNDMVRTDTITLSALLSIPELETGYIIQIHYPTVEETIFDFLVKELQLSAAAACGIMANMKAESGYNPEALGDPNFLKEDGTKAYGNQYAVGEGTSFGLCQWHCGNWDNLKNYCAAHGYDSHSLEGQLWFLKYTVLDLQRRTSEGRLLIDVLRELSDTPEGAYEAAYLFCTEYEHPAAMEYQGRRRGGIARETIYPAFG